MLQSVFKDIFGDHAGALGGGEQAHEGGLQVGGEAWEGLGSEVDSRDSIGLHGETNAVVLNRAAGLLEFGDHGPEMLGDHRRDAQVGAGDGRGEHEGAGFNAVRNHGVVGAVEPLHPGDGDGGGAGTPHPGTHGQQQAGQVYNFRFQRGVFDHRLAFGEGGGHHQGFGGAHAGAIEIDAPTGEAVAPAGHHGGDHPVLNGDLGAEGFEALDMLDHGTGADLAAAGQGHLGHAHARQEGADAEEAGPQAVHQLVGSSGIVDVIAVELDAVGGVVHRAAQAAQHLAHGADVGERRHVAEPNRVAGEQAGGHQHQG